MDNKNQTDSNELKLSESDTNETNVSQQATIRNASESTDSSEQNNHTVANPAKSNGHNLQTVDPLVDSNSDNQKSDITTNDTVAKDATNEATVSETQSKTRVKTMDTTPSQDQVQSSVTSKGSSVHANFDTKKLSPITYCENEPDLLESVRKNASNRQLIDRLLGCAYGQALGDAYGLATEFEDRHDVDRKYLGKSGLIPFPKYVKTNHNRRWKEGDWTDDTDQWLLILDTLVYHDGDVKKFAEKLTSWINHGYPELGDYGGMGIGANVYQVVRSVDFLDDPLRVSENVWRRGGCKAAPNGAVMRCSAAAFVHFNDRDKVISTTEQLAKTTHFDPRCIASCLAICLTITYLLTEETVREDIEGLVKRVQDETIALIGEGFSEEDRKTFLWHTNQRTLEELNLDEPNSIGYTYKCLASGFYGLRSQQSFAVTLNDLIRYGGDADTNGAVCGTMYGARYGYDALPQEWLRQMPYKKWLDQKLIECLKKIGLNGAQFIETRV